MAASLTSNLKLRLSEDLTADARYNLNKIDTLGGSTLVDNTGNLRVRSKLDISIEPNSADIGGTGQGGTVTLGNSDSDLTRLDIYAETIDFNDATLTGLTVAWDDLDFTSSDASDIVNIQSVISANSAVALNTAHRSLTNNPHNVTAAQVGAYTESEVDSLIAPLASTASLTAHTSASSGVHGVTGSVVGTSDTQTLTNKSINASNNTLSNIRNTNLAADAAISYSKLSLAASLEASDLSSGFSLPWSKLNKTGSSLSDLDTRSHTQLSDIGTNTHAQIDSHIAATSAHGVSGNIVGTTDSQTLTNKTVDASANTITNIADASIKSDASISGSKINPDFGNQVIKTTASLQFSEGGYTTDIRGAQSGQVANLTFNLPSADGSAGQVLRTNGSGELGWTTVLGDALDQYHMDVGDASNNRVAVDTSSVGDIQADTVNGLVIKAGVIQNADISASAAIALSKLAALTADRALASNGSGVIAVSATTATELGYVAGVTSSIQDQIDLKLDDPMTTRGDIVYRDSTNTTERLALGTDGQVLQSDGTDLAWATLSTSDIIEGTKLFFTDERAQDAVGTILDATATVGFTYDDTNAIITADVIPAGVDHDSLLNFVANEHINHSSVSVIAGTGLSGGGDITTSRTLDLDIDSLTDEASASDSDSIAIYDLSATALRKQTRANFLSGYALLTDIPQSFKADWETADGNTKTVTHNIGSVDLIVQLFDSVTGETIYADSVIRTDSNTLDLSITNAPTNTIRILIQEIL
jgi:hypothetical protein